MKKFVALLLAMLLVLANVAALAEGLDDLAQNIEDLGRSRDATATSKIADFFYKKYKTDVAGVFPAETLSFRVDTNNKAAITVNNYDVDNTYNNAWIKTGSDYVKATADTYKTATEIYYKVPFSIGIPGKDYTAAGKYTSTFTEAPGSTQGVQYDSAKTGTTATTFTVDVYVIRDADGALQVDTVNVYTAQVQSGTKPSEITNAFTTGDLTVTKSIKGNFANVNKDFEIEIELTSTDTVGSVIDVTFSNDASAKEGSAITETTTTTDDATTTSYSIQPSDWSNKKAKITLIAHNNGSVKLDNIPAGVTYTINEISVKRIGEGLDYATQEDALNDDNAYAVTGEKTGVTITKNARETVVNTKEYNIPDTGIVLETAPYMLIMLIALAGVALIARKRNEV